MRAFLPSAITLVGAVLGLVAAAIFPCRAFVALALLSLACDFADGTVARLVEAESDLGKALDWTTDCALAHLFLWRCCRPENAAVLSAVLVVVQATTSSVPISAFGFQSLPRVSGRTLATLVSVFYAVIA